MSEASYYDELDTALTELTRLARGPRLSSVMSAGVERDVDRNLMPLLGLIVDRGPVRASDLQSLIAVEQSTLSRQLASLVERGLVVRDDDPSDRRAALLTASPRAREAVLAARAAWRETLAALMESWDPAEREEFLRGMTRLSDDLGRHVGEPGFAPSESETKRSRPAAHQLRTGGRSAVDHPVGDEAERAGGPSTPHGWAQRSRPLS